MRRYLALNARLLPLNLCLIVGTLIAGACAAPAAEPTPQANVAQECAVRVDLLADDLLDLNSNIETFDPATDSTASIIRQARGVVADGRDLIADCGHLAPREALELSDALDEIEAATDLLESY